MTRTLILGGTAWLGRELAEQLLAQGKDVTVLARGVSGPAPVGSTFVAADRLLPGAYDEVKNVEWDEVIELAYEQNLVAGALEALSHRTKHWTLVSSVSVYERNNEPGASEEAKLVDPTNLEDYAHAKVFAEQITESAVGDRLLIARPGLIAGPGDRSDRFSYWVSRLALAANGKVLVPHPEGRYVQFIDVRDLAGWLLHAGSSELTGTYNVVGSEHTFSDVLLAAAKVAGFTGELIAADDSWLDDHDVNYWAGPHSLPLWLPIEDVAFAQRSGERFVAAGGSQRSLVQTLQDVLADERARGLDRVRRSGLRRTEELVLLAKISGSEKY